MNLTMSEKKITVQNPLRSTTAQRSMWETKSTRNRQENPGGK